MRCIRGMRGGLVLLCLLACSGEDTPRTVSEPPPAAMSSVAAQYLAELLTLMEAHSVNRRSIDWPRLGTTVRAAAAGAQTIRDTYPGIRAALVGLGDGHSLFQTPGGALISAGETSCAAPTPGTVPLAPNIGYLRIPAFSGGLPESRDLAKQLHQSIQSADTGVITGWVVDLRGNVGGNMWPMLAGVGPILGEGAAGHFVDGDGVADPWGYAAGASYLGTLRVVETEAPYRLRAPNPRVAVLVDGAVASSGEAIAIAFKGRASTRFFGTPTCGVSTANRAFGMSDGAFLILTVATMADRNKVVYGGRVLVDEQIIGLGPLFARVTAWLQASN